MDRYIIYKTFTGIKGTTESNYNAHIQNARLIKNFNMFDNVQDVQDYIIKYFGYTSNNIIIIDN